MFITNVTDFPLRRAGQGRAWTWRAFFGRRWSSIFQKRSVSKYVLGTRFLDQRLPRIATRVVGREWAVIPTVTPTLRPRPPGPPEPLHSWKMFTLSAVRLQEMFPRPAFSKKTATRVVGREWADIPQRPPGPPEPLDSWKMFTLGADWFTLKCREHPKVLAFRGALFPLLYI